jgi:DNA helicase HerA-like ATPase
MIVNLPVTAEAAVLGHIVSVSGSRLSAVLAAARGVATAQVRIGDLLRIETPDGAVFGIAQALEAGHIGDDRRTVEIDVFGEMNEATGHFQRGVSRHPVLGATVIGTSHDDLARIFAPPSNAVTRIGSVHQDTSLPAYVLVDQLLGKHLAVLGTTGSGKSCTVTLILKSILRDHPHGHVILLDPHDEYGQAFGAVAERLTTANLELPYWLLDFEEISSLLIPRETSGGDSERNILKAAIVEAKKKFVTSGDTDHITVDTPVPYRLSELIRTIEVAMGKLEKADTVASYVRLVSRVQGLQADKRYGFMFSGVVVRDSLSAIAKRLLRVPVGGRPVTVIDLSGVPSEIVDVVVSVLSRLIFDLAVWNASPRSLPVLMVCEEAHRYIPAERGAGFAPTRRVLARIAKEGRKYGVSLCLVSQRPSELDSSILSQCNTIFALRMNNERDQDFVRAVLPESAQGLIGSLPSLHNQEALVVGEGVSVPMRVRFDDLAPEERPRSATASFSTAWRAEIDAEALIAATVDRWRRQTR